MTKDDVAAALEEIGTLLQLQGENDFRVKAYTGGARLVSSYEGDFRALVDGGKLTSIRGIGETLAEKIATLMKTGALPMLDELRAAVPVGLREMLRIPGLGPKKVKALHDELSIDSLDGLRQACEEGAVAGLKGFGAKTQAKILEGLAFVATAGQRVRIDEAEAIGRLVLDRLKQLPGISRAELCGSLRRRRETAKDLDLLAVSDNPADTMARFVAFPEVQQVAGHGETKSSVLLKFADGTSSITMNADLRLVTSEQFPFALVYFTGSKDHNIRLRQLAIERGLSLNEYALAGEAKHMMCKDEAAVYAALDLEWISPELREDTGEVEAAAEKKLPKLLEYGDLRGVFHNHTTASDGTATLEVMARKCIELGWDYFGIADHSQSLNVANGLKPDRVRQQWAEIDELNSKLGPFRILKGTESDILVDGSLDYDDELLAGFDYVVASVHTHFHLNEAEQTERVCKALAHPATTMLGHATGRLLLRRDGYKVDLDRVIAAAAEHGKMIEINAQPMRLDLDWKWVKRAKAAGVKLVVNPDAHSPGELELTPFGVDVARRGWLTKADVFNTLGLKDVLKVLKRK